MVRPAVTQVGVVAWPKHRDEKVMLDVKGSLRKAPSSQLAAYFPDQQPYGPQSADCASAIALIWARFLQVPVRTLDWPSLGVRPVAGKKNQSARRILHLARTYVVPFLAVLRSDRHIDISP
jgi:hypothetical protein